MIFLSHKFFVLAMRRIFLFLLIVLERRPFCHSSSFSSRAFQVTFLSQIFLHKINNISQ